MATQSPRRYRERGRGRSGDRRDVDRKQPALITIGSDAGTPSRCGSLATTGVALADFSPFGATAVEWVAVGDVTGDGMDDIVIVPAGTVGMLEVIDGRTGAYSAIMPFSRF